jgi:predicted RNase H-like HicB family nuclease
MAHGYTQEEALANANEAIGLWLDTAKEFGDQIPEPKGRRLMYA